MYKANPQNTRPTKMNRLYQVIRPPRMLPLRFIIFPFLASHELLVPNPHRQIAQAIRTILASHMPKEAPRARVGFHLVILSPSGIEARGVLFGTVFCLVLLLVAAAILLPGGYSSQELK